MTVFGSTLPVVRTACTSESARAELLGGPGGAGRMVRLRHKGGADAHFIFGGSDVEAEPVVVLIPPTPRALALHCNARPSHFPDLLHSGACDAARTGPRHAARRRPWDQPGSLGRALDGCGHNATGGAGSTASARAVVQASPFAFALLRWAGATYLARLVRPRSHGRAGRCSRVDSYELVLNTSAQRSMAKASSRGSRPPAMRRSNIAAAMALKVMPLPP